MKINRSEKMMLHQILDLVIERHNEGMTTDLSIVSFMDVTTLNIRKYDGECASVQQGCETLSSLIGNQFEPISNVLTNLMGERRARQIVKEGI